MKDYASKNTLTKLIENIKEADATKQDKLTGTEGQVVGFDDMGNPISTNARTYGRIVDVVLSAGAWGEDKRQTVAVEGIVADESKQAIQYTQKRSDTVSGFDYGISCVEQGENSLIFECQTIPTDDLNYYILVMDAVSLDIQTSADLINAVEAAQAKADNAQNKANSCLPLSGGAMSGMIQGGLDYENLLYMRKIKGYDHVKLGYYWESDNGKVISFMGAPENDVSMSYNVRLDGIDDPTTSYNAANKLYVDSRRNNDNLLDNWYFADSINQRGQTEYTANGYTIDRWFVNNGTVKLEEDGLLVTLNSMYSSLIQRREKGLEGQVSFSVLIDSLSDGGSLYISVEGTDGIQAYADIRANGLVTASGISTASSVNNSIVNNQDNPVTFKLKAAKLELGPVQTLAHKEGDTWVLNDPPPNKAKELLKCQRYLYVLPQTADAYSPIGIGSAYTTNNVTFQVPIPCKMRTTPSVTASGGFSLTGNSISFIFNSTDVGMSIGTATPSLLTLIVAGLPQNVQTENLYLLNTDNNNSGRLVFSAEL